MLVLDTSFLVEFERERRSGRDGAAVAYLARHRPIPVGVSVVSLGEFAEGFDHPVSVERFLSRFRVLQLSRSIAYRAAAIQSSLAQRLGENDAWIAATAITYRARLVGREASFARVPGLDYDRF